MLNGIVGVLFDLTRRCCYFCHINLLIPQIKACKPKEGNWMLHEIDKQMMKN